MAIPNSDYGYHKKYKIMEENTHKVNVGGIEYDVIIDKRFEFREYDTREMYHLGRCNYVPVYIREQDGEYQEYALTQGAGLFSRIKTAIQNNF